MVWRYILAFLLSIILLFGWQIYIARKRENNLPKVEQDVPREEKPGPAVPAVAGPPGQGAIGGGKPAAGAAGGEKPVGKTPDPAAKPTGIEVAWKDGLGSIERILKGEAELVSFDSGGGLGLSLASGENDWGRTGDGWKALEDDPGGGGNSWTHELETGKFKITRRVTAGVTGDGILRLDVALGFENKGAEAIRYRLGGASRSGDGFVAASRVRLKGKGASVESRSLAAAGEPWRREGQAQWVALRRRSRLAVLFSKDADYAAAALVDAAGASLEGHPVAPGFSEHHYQLAIGTNEPHLLASYGVKGELSRINRNEVELVPGRFRVLVDSGRGSITGISLLDHFTAVEGDPGREVQPLLLESPAGATLLSMGSSIGPTGDAAENWGGPWTDTIRDLPGGGKEIIFEKQVGSVLIRKKISPAAVDEFDELLGEGVGALADGRLLRVGIELTNLANVQAPFPFMLYGPCAVASTSVRSAGLDIQLAFGIYGRKQGVLSEIHDSGDLPSLANPREVAWLSTVNSYFTALMFPRSREEGARGIYAEEMPYPVRGWWPKADGAPEEETRSLRVGFKCTSHLPPGGNPRELVFGVYLGPRVSSFIEAGDALDLEGANDFGITSSLIHFFMGVLNLLHKVTLGNWGLAIILLTVLVKLCLHPVTRKNQRGMMRMGKVMGKIKPEMDALQERYGQDRMKYSQEVQKLWKKHNVNPGKQMLGCLVIFLQMPIWIGIIWSLDYSIGLRQASFLYIEDLTRPDMLFQFPGGISVPLLGWEHFNLLPVLYVVLTLVNQKMKPRSEDPQAAAQQRMMGFMMIFFGVIFYGFAAGFMLYIMTSAALGIAESKIIKAQLAREDLEEDGAAAVAAATQQAPLYTVKKTSSEKSVVPSSAKKKKKRRRRN